MDGPAGVRTPDIRQLSYHTPSEARADSRWDWVKEGWTVGLAVVRLVEALEDLLLSPNIPSSAARDPWRCPDVATWSLAAGHAPLPPQGGLLLLLTPLVR